MTALQNPEAIRHFQSLCDACQALASRYHSPAELRLYADGYLHALRRTEILDPISQRRLEELVDRWILDPSSFIGPEGDLRTLYERSRN
jgi:hypothetical protein